MLYFHEIIKLINTVSRSYYISMNSDSCNSKLYSYYTRFDYSGMGYQILEKMLLNNFEKIYVNLDFKNQKSENKYKAYNSIILELGLQTINNSVAVTKIKAIQCFENVRMIHNFKQLCENHNIDFKYHIIEKDIKKINDNNFRQPIKIKRLDSWVYSEVTDKSKEQDVDIINDKFYKSSKFKIKYSLTLFNYYVVNKDLIFNFDEYESVMESFGTAITSINSNINTEYKNEKYLLRWLFRNKNIMFIDTAKAYFSVEDILDLLNELKKINKENSNLNKLYEFVQMLSTVVSTKFEKNEEDYLKLSNLLPNNTKITKSNHYSNSWAHSRYYHLSFDFNDKFKLNINIDNKKTEYTDELFKTLQNKPIFFNLLEKAYSDKVMDFITKEYIVLDA